MLAEHKELILKQRENGMTYEQIAKELREQFGIIVTRQAINKYVKKLESKEAVEDEIIDAQVLAIINESKSARSAHLKLKELGYEMSYNKVANIRNSRK